jgi:hypothetical protein
MRERTWSAYAGVVSVIEDPIQVGYLLAFVIPSSAQRNLKFVMEVDKV